MAKAEKLVVVDSSTTIDNHTRVHQIIHDGKILDIVFKHNQGTELPADQALKFNQEGFTVYEADGVTPYKAPIKRDGTNIQLQEGEVIARIEELSQEALYLRCILKHGGEVFDEESAADDMINFLLHGVVNTKSTPEAAQKSVEAAKKETAPKSNAKPAGEVSRKDKIALLRQNGYKFPAAVKTDAVDKMYAELMSPKTSDEAKEQEENKAKATAGNPDNGDIDPDMVGKMLEELGA